MTRSEHARILRLVAGRWRGLALIVLLTAALSAASALLPLPMKLLVDHALGGRPLPGAVEGLLANAGLPSGRGALVVAAAAASLMVFVVYTGVQGALTLTWTSVGQRMVFDLAARVFERLQRLSLAYHTRHATGDSLGRLSSDAYCVYALTESALVAPPQHVFTLITVSVIAWNLDARLTLLSWGLAPIMALSARYFGRRVKQTSRQKREAQSHLMSFVHQTLGAIPLVQGFDALQRNRRRYASLTSHAVAVSQRGAFVSSAYGLATGAIVSAGLAAVLIVGGRRVLAGTLSLGTLLVFLAYLKTLQGAVKGLLGIHVKLKTAAASVDRIMEVLDADEMLPDAAALPSGGGRLPRPRAAGRIRFEHVSFGYDPAVAILKDIHLEIEPGETVAIVGPIGAGKSTLVSLVPRFFDPWQGRVTLDGRDLRELPLNDLRAHIAMVLQEPFILPLPVRDVIAFGRPEADLDDVVAAAVAAGADEFIRGLPHGYETIIAERGATLSGGQKQRLALARAFLRDAPILILDEPTAALDARTEADLLDALGRLTPGRTTLMIAHRLSTVRRADRIVVLQDGRVAEAGSHQTLLATGGTYSRLHALAAPRLAGANR